MRPVSLRRIPPPIAWRAGLFVGVFAVYLIYLRIFGDPHFYFDAAGYWNLGGAFGKAGHFSLLDFYSPIRGYSLPLYNRGLQSIAGALGMGSVTIVFITGALEVALLGVILIPQLVRALWPAAQVTPARIALLNVIIFVFWRDYLGFPLSDFPAVTLAIAGFVALTRRSPLGYALAGLALGLAWNVRPAYSVMLAIAVLLVAYRATREGGPLRGGRAVALLVIGIFIASLPQILVNHRHAHSWSPEVPSIVAEQLTKGMYGQRYETYVGTKRAPAVLYVDSSTQTILRKEHLIAISSASQYARLVVKYPTEMIAAWARRFFDGMDVRYSTPYIHNLSAVSVWFCLVNYTLLFLALVRMLVPAFRRQLGSVAWPEALVFCCACVPAIPFAVETRYFIPIQFVVYALVVFGTTPRQAWSALGRSDRISLAIVYPLFLLACVTLSTSSIAVIASST